MSPLANGLSTSLPKGSDERKICREFRHGVVMSTVADTVQDTLIESAAGRWIR